MTRPHHARSLMALAGLLTSIAGCASAPAQDAPAAGVEASSPSSSSDRPRGPASATRPTVVQSAIIDEAPTGTTVRVEPAGITLTIPGTLGGSAFSGPKLADVKSCRSEWDTEFALVANAALPFERLLAHVGSEPFCHGASYDDVSVRVYVLDASIADAARSIEEGGEAEIARISTKNGGPVQALDPKWGPIAPDGWTRVLLEYGRFYSDYGATARVDTYLQRIAGVTLAVTFFWTRGVAHFADGVRVDPVAEVLASVRAR